MHGITAACDRPSQRQQAAGRQGQIRPYRLVNAQLIEAGLARSKKSAEPVQSRMVDTDVAMELHAELQKAEQVARKSRSGMWRYGDVGEEDPDDI